MSDFNQDIIDEFRANEGRVEAFGGANLVLLHTTGAKSGQERINPLVFQRVGDSLAVFASKAGAPTNPDWFHNVLAHPQVEVEIGTDKMSMTARVADPDERDRIWGEQKKRVPGFADYEAKTTRTIPVVVLEPASA